MTASSTLAKKLAESAHNSMASTAKRTSTAAKTAATNTTVSKTGSRGNNTAEVSKQDNPIGTGKVTCAALNVRNGAGTSFARIGGLSKGKTIQVYEEKDGWLRIAYGSGFGWVSKQYTDYKSQTPVVTPEPTPTPTPEPQPTPAPSFEQFQGKVTPADGLNVRQGPGTGYSKITALTQGTVVTVIGEQNGWYQIQYNGITGWVSGEYISKVSGGSTPTPTPTPDPTPTPTPSTDNKQVMTTTGVNMRDMPGNGGTPASGSSVYFTIPSGTLLDVHAEQNGWYQVTYNGKTGWVCGQYTATYTKPNVDPGKPQSAADLAYSYLGKTTKNLVGTLPYLQDLSGYAGTNNGYDLNCANFVSAILQNCSLLNSHQINVSGVRKACTDFGYRIIDKSNAKPGDVWCNSGHTEIVYKNNGGTVQLVGSNNGGDDVQEISLDSYSAQKNGDIYSIQ